MATTDEARGTFRLMGVPVRIQPAFVIIVLLLNVPALSRVETLVAWVLIATSGVLVHEFGHALAIRSFGHQPSIVLHGFGGATSWRPEASKPVGQGARILIALAGPFTGIAIACIVGIVAMVAGHSPLRLLAAALGASDLNASFTEIVVGYALFVNGGWGVLNLIPIFPLDGGQVFTAAAESVLPGRGRAIALLVSILLAVGLGLFALKAGSYWTAIVVGMLAVQSWTSFRVEQVRARDYAVLPALDRARALLAQRQLAAARAEAETVHAAAKTAEIKIASLELIAWSHVTEKHFVEAAAALRRADDSSRIDPVLEGLVMTNTGQIDEGLARLELAFGKSPNEGLALLLLGAYVQLRRWGDLVQLLSDSNARMMPARALFDAAEEAFRQEHFHEAAQIGAFVFELTRDPNVAYRTACAHARVDKLNDAMTWLVRARDVGFADRAKLDREEDFEGLRRAPGWFDFRATVPNA